MLDRSVRALQAAGLDLRRVREQPTPAGAPRQAFFRLGERQFLDLRFVHGNAELGAIGLHQRNRGLHLDRLGEQAARDAEQRCEQLGLKWRAGTAGSFK